MDTGTAEGSIGVIVQGLVVNVHDAGSQLLSDSTATAVVKPPPRMV
jgi:hypothetical protein